MAIYDRYDLLLKSVLRFMRLVNVTFINQLDPWPSLA